MEGERRLRAARARGRGTPTGVPLTSWPSLKEALVGRPEPTRVGLITVGCKLNQYETEGLTELFERLGMAIVPFEEQADVYVVNTCTVTSRSDYRSRQMVRRAARTNPEAVVVVTGCYAQRDPEALLAMPEVRLVVGNSEKRRTAELVREVLARGSVAAPAEAVVAGAWSRAFDPFDIERFRGYTRAFVKIQDGCDGACAYCAVPGARGPARSRPLASVLDQARRLATAGHREVVLTGVHIGAYRADGAGLAELLRELSEIHGLERIRLGSVEPKELTDELASAVVSLAIAAVGVLSSELSIALVLALAGLVGGYNNIVLISWFQERVQPEFMGRVMSVLMFGWVGLMPVSYPVAGALAQWSISGMFLISGLTAVAITMLCATSPNLRRVQ